MNIIYTQLNLFGRVI